MPVAVFCWYVHQNAALMRLAIQHADAISTTANISMSVTLGFVLFSVPMICPHDIMTSTV